MTSVFCFLLIFTIFMVFIQPSASQAVRPETPEGTKILRDLAYVNNGHERQKLDLYLPARGEKLPLIINIHGGAFMMGSKDDMVPLNFLSEGFAVASINYRLSKHAIFPAQIEDCKAAVRWLRKNASKYGIDPDRFGAIGASAGGYLVAMLGTTGDFKEFDVGENLDVSSRVQAVVDMFGPTDFLKMDDHRLPDGQIHNAPDSPESLLIGGNIQENKDKVAEANPITYITSDDPPFLIIHGDSDPLVPHHQSELLEKALRNAGVSAAFYTVKGGGHGGFKDEKVDPLIKDFFANILKPKATESKLDDDNTILMDGKRFFPIGIYYIPKGDEPFKELADAGFNLVRCDTKEQLDMAQESGLKVWYSFGDRPANVKGNKGFIESKVAELKSHPALLAYESMDEPAWTWKKDAEPRVSAESLAEGHRLLKELDPDHLLWINHAPRNTEKTLARFSQYADILACDVYPVISKDIDADKTYAIMPNGKQTDLANQTISCVGEYVDKMKRAAGPGRGTWIVLQGFAWDNEKSDNPLYPTYEETRFMAYNAIIHGVKGILYWGTYSMPQPSQRWTDLKMVSRELANIMPVLAAPDFPCILSLDYEEMGYSIDKGVEYIVKEYDGAKYIISANTTIGPVNVTFSGIPFPADSPVWEDTAEVMFEDRAIAISNGSFVDSFEPYGVHVYRIMGD